MLADGIILEKNTLYHNDFYRSILKTESKDPFADILKQGSIIFLKGFENVLAGIHNQKLDNVLLPSDHFTNKSSGIQSYITKAQYDSMKLNVDMFSRKQQFVINDFLLVSDLEPISEFFVKRECLNCMKYDSLCKYMISNEDQTKEVTVYCSKCDYTLFNDQIKIQRKLLAAKKEKKEVQLTFREVNILSDMYSIRDISSRIYFENCDYKIIVENSNLLSR